MVRDIDVICRHVIGLGSLNGLTVEEEAAFERHVRASGLMPSEWIRKHRRQREAADAEGRTREQNNLVTNSSQGFSPDLDFWADVEPDDGDDDDLKPCPVCNGRGRDASGNTCESCKGTGRAGDENDEDDNGQEREDGEEE
jgi:hypothetical protein